MKIDKGSAFIPGVSLRMRGGPGTSSPGRIRYTQVSLLQVLKKAWDVQDYQIVGPDWLKRADRALFYTIEATLPAGTTKQDFQLMLQDLVERRFRMEFHHEVRRLSGYDLVIAKGGPKLRKARVVAVPESSMNPPTGVDKWGFPLLPPGHGAGVVVKNDGMHAKFQEFTMNEFASGYLRLFVAGEAGEPGPIRDKTGLTDKYDFTLSFDNRGGRVQAAPAVHPRLPTGSAGGDAPNVAIQLDTGNFPGIFKAIEDQLGLRLVRAKDIPINVLLIDHIEKVPTEN